MHILHLPPRALAHDDHIADVSKMIRNRMATGFIVYSSRLLTYAPSEEDFSRSRWYPTIGGRARFPPFPVAEGAIFPASLPQAQCFIRRCV